MNKDCIFCKIIRGEIPAKKAFEDDEVLAFEDINPQAPVHLLIIPKLHLEHIEAAEDKDLTLMGKLLLVARNLARVKGVAQSGYRLVINTNPQSGQEVYHLHLHLLGGRRFTWPPG